MKKEAMDAGIPLDFSEPLQKWRNHCRVKSYLHWAITLVVLSLFFFSVQYLNIDLSRIFGVFGRVSEAIIQRYSPPDFAYVAKADYLKSVFDTLHMAFLGTLVGVLLSVPLACFAAYNMTPSRRVFYPIARFLIIASRSVHEMIWVILFVAILGFGMLPGVLSLIVFTIGFTGKLFSEEIEIIDMGQVEAVKATGASRMQIFCYAVWPQTKTAFWGISIYSWDAAFRAATFVGFFGAGGMGHYLKQQIMQLEMQRVAAILSTIIILVVASEFASAYLRHKITKSQQVRSKDFHEMEL